MCGGERSRSPCLSVGRTLTSGLSRVALARVSRQWQVWAVVGTNLRVNHTACRWPTSPVCAGTWRNWTLRGISECHMGLALALVYSGRRGGSSRWRLNRLHALTSGVSMNGPMSRQETAISLPRSSPRNLEEPAWVASSGGNRDGAHEAWGTPLKRAPWLGKWPDASPTVTSPPFGKTLLVASRRGGSHITHRTSGTPRGGEGWDENAGKCLLRPRPSLSMPTQIASWDAVTAAARMRLDGLFGMC